MNEDLKFRLTPFQDLSGTDDIFFCKITERLCKAALTGQSERKHVRAHFHPLDLEDCDTGYIEATEGGSTFHVHLDNRMPVGMVLDYLCHELAHAHSWDVADDKEDHCEEFGKSYAFLYREYLKLYEANL